MNPFGPVPAPTQRGHFKFYEVEGLRQSKQALNIAWLGVFVKVKTDKNGGQRTVNDVSRCTCSWQFSRSSYCQDRRRRRHRQASTRYGANWIETEVVWHSPAIGYGAMGFGGK